MSIENPNTINNNEKKNNIPSGLSGRALENWNQNKDMEGFTDKEKQVFSHEELKSLEKTKELHKSMDKDREESKIKAKYDELKDSSVDGDKKELEKIRNSLAESIVDPETIMRLVKKNDTDLVRSILRNNTKEKNLPKEIALEMISKNYEMAWQAVRNIEAFSSEGNSYKDILNLIQQSAYSKYQQDTLLKSLRESR